MVSEQLGVEISETTVRNVLARKRSTPKRPTSPERLQNWKTFLSNHRGSTTSMNFKVTFDWRAKPLYILNIIDHAHHGRRALVACRATMRNIGHRWKETDGGERRKSCWTE